MCVVGGGCGGARCGVCVVCLWCVGVGGSPFNANASKNRACVFVCVCVCLCVLVCVCVCWCVLMCVVKRSRNYFEGAEGTITKLERIDQDTVVFYSSYGGMDYREEIRF